MQRSLEKQGEGKNITGSTALTYTRLLQSVLGHTSEEKNCRECGRQMIKELKTRSLKNARLGVVSQKGDGCRETDGWQQV